MKPKEQRMKDIEAQYPDQWVLIQVTRSDRYGRTTHGIAIAHGSEEDKETLTRQHIAFRKASPQAITSLRWTGRLIPEGLGVAL